MHASCTCLVCLQAIIQKGSGSRAVTLEEFQDLMSEALIAKVRARTAGCVCSMWGSHVAGGNGAKRVKNFCRRCEAKLLFFIEIK